MGSPCSLQSFYYFSAGSGRLSRMSRSLSALLLLAACLCAARALAVPDAVEPAAGADAKLVREQMSQSVCTARRRARQQKFEHREMIVALKLPAAPFSRLQQCSHCQEAARSCRRPLSSNPTPLPPPPCRPALRAASSRRSILLAARVSSTGLAGQSFVCT